MKKKNTRRGKVSRRFQESQNGLLQHEKPSRGAVVLFSRVGGLLQPRRWRTAPDSSKETYTATWKEPSHTVRELPHLKIVKTLQLQIKPRPPGLPVCEHPEQFLNARHHGIVSFSGSRASSTVALPLITFSRTKRISTSKHSPTYTFNSFVSRA